MLGSRNFFCSPADEEMDYYGEVVGDHFHHRYNSRIGCLHGDVPDIFTAKMSGQGIEQPLSEQNQCVGGCLTE